MALDDIVQLSITTQSVTPTRPGFGTGLLLANSVPVGFTDVVRSYGNPSELISDGFATNSVVYKDALSYWSSNPRPTKFKVGKRTSKSVQTLHFQVTQAVVGDVFLLTLGATTKTYTVPSSPTTTTIATALAALWGTVTGYTATSTTDTVAVTATAGAGTILDVSNWSSNLKFADVTADPGVVADLQACADADSDWYGVLLDSCSPAEITAAAAWVETQNKIFVARTSDTACMDPSSTTDVMAALKALDYTNTAVFFRKNQLLSYIDSGIMGNRFAGANPGQDTWAYKQVPGVLPDLLTSAQRSAILGKSGNTYTTVAGVNITEDGTCASGQYADVVRFIAWLKSEIQIRLYAALVNLQKIPYTDKGVAVVVAIIKGTLDDGIKAGGLASNPAPVVTAPAVADVDPTTRGMRILPNVTFTATLAGAIHVVQIQGVVSV